MALQQFPITELIKAIQARVLTGTGRKCLDYVGMNQESPFYYAEFRGSKPANSKTMYMMDYTVSIHVIAEKATSSVPVYQYLQELQEAMTEDVEIPEPYRLVMQTDNGVTSLYTDETGEKHGVASFTFRICYGFKIKV